ncbi:unnamed protein product, partial [Prorocentrum cordatum]
DEEERGRGEVRMARGAAARVFWFVGRAPPAMAQHRPPSVAARRNARRAPSAQLSPSAAASVSASARLSAAAPLAGAEAPRAEGDAAARRPPTPVAGAAFAEGAPPPGEGAEQPRPRRDLRRLPRRGRFVHRSPGRGRAQEAV